MPAKPISSIAVAMHFNCAKPSTQILQFPAIPRIQHVGVIARKEYNRAGHGSPHWHSFWVL